MQQRVSLITLGVADVRAAREFYERLGWSAPTTARRRASRSSRPAGWHSRCGTAASLPRTARSSDGGGWGGVTLAYNVGSPEEVDA